MQDSREPAETTPAPAAGKPPAARRRTRHRRQWLISPEGFRELRHTCLLSNRKAAAAYLGVCVRTIRHWDAGRSRVPWSAVRLLRLLRAGELGGLLDGWEGWTIYRDRLVSPDGRAYLERDMRRLWLTLTQAALFREAYDRETHQMGLVDCTGGADRRREWNDRHFPADGAGEPERADRETATVLDAPSPLPCQTASEVEAENRCPSRVSDRGKKPPAGGGRSPSSMPVCPWACLFVNNSSALTVNNPVFSRSGAEPNATFPTPENAHFATPDNRPDNGHRTGEDNGR